MDKTKNLTLTEKKRLEERLETLYTRDNIRFVGFVDKEDKEYVEMKECFRDSCSGDWSVCMINYSYFDGMGHVNHLYVSRVRIPVRNISHRLRALDEERYESAK